MHAIQPRLVLWVLLLPVFLLAAEGERYWERFPDLPPRRAVTSVGVDSHDGLWVLAFGVCLHWDVERREWEAPALPPECPERLWQGSGLFGTPETGLYLLRVRVPGDTVHVSRLLDGKIEGVTTFRGRDRNGQIDFRPCLGERFLHWDAEGLDVYAGGNWRRLQVKWPNLAQRVLDRGDTVSLCTPPRLCTVDAGGATTATDVAKETLAANQHLIVVWGKDGAVAAKEGCPGLSAFRIGTGERMDMNHANLVLADCPVHELVAAPDGSVLVWANRPGESLRLFYRLTPDGEVQPIPDTLGLGRTPFQSSKYPRSVQADPQGRVWFADATLGVFCLDGDRVRQFDPDSDRSPAQATALALDRKGVVYAISDGGLYGYNQGASLTGQPRPAPLDRALLGKSVWEVPVVDGVAASAHRFGDHALVGIETSPGVPWGTEIVDLASGRGSFSLAQTTADHGKRACADRESDCVLLAQGGYAYVVSLATGQVLRELAVEDAIRRDAKSAAISRVPAWRPLASLPGDRYVFSHSAGLVCLDKFGQVVWRHEFPDYTPQSPPLVARNQLILQTMGGDRCETTTCALDLDTGKTTWSQSAPRRGSGMVLTGDRRRFVEVNREAGVSCRRASDGELVWRYGRFGAAALGQPVLDPAGHHAYVHFDDAVVCLDLADGQMVWETALPSAASLPRWFYLTSGRDCLSLAQGVLLLTNGQGVLHLLDPATGVQLARFPLAGEVSRHGNRSGRVELAGAPWMVRDHLVVPLATGLYAYRLPLAAYLPPGRRPTVAWASPPAEQPDMAELALPLATTGTGKMTVQYQIDAREWRGEPLVSPVHSVALAGLAAGRHRLRLAVFDGAGRASAELVHGFELKADLAPAGPAVVGAVVVPAPPSDILLALPPSVSVPPVDDSCYWERFPLPPGGSPSISRMAVDEEDRVWVMTQQGYFRWEVGEGRWVDSGLRFRSGGSLGDTLCGGPQTGVYAALFPQGWQGEGQLLRLTAGVPVPTATIPQGGPRIIPARGGCVAALSSQSLWVLLGKDWREWPFSRNATSFQADQVGDTLWVRYDNELILVSSRGEAWRHRIGDLPMPNSVPPLSTQVNWTRGRFAPWGKDRALLASNSLWVVDLRSDEPERSVTLEAALGGKLVRDLQTLADGSVLAIADDRRLGRSSFCRIAVDGTVQPLAHGIQLPPGVGPFHGTPGSVVEDAVGGIWVALPQTGVLRLGVGAQARWFIPDEDGSPVDPRSLAADSQGRVYATSEGFLYVYNRGASRTGQGCPLTRRVLPPGNPLWQAGLSKGQPIGTVVRVGDVVLLCPAAEGGSGTVEAVGLGDGHTRFGIPLGKQDMEWFSAGPGNQPTELTVRRSKGLVVLGAATGETVRSLAWLGDAQEDGHPLPLRADRLFLPRRTGSALPCFDQLGHKIWELDAGKLGHLYALPAVQGDYAVFQTQVEQSGRMPVTSLVELDTGQVVWSGEDVLRRPGSAFLMDGECIVGFGRPDRRDLADFGLVCLDARSGQQRWVHDLPAREHSYPVVDAATRRIYLHLADGSVACVDGDLGTQVWRTLLPHLPCAPPAGYLSRPSSLSLERGMVLAADRTAVLTMLDMATGAILGHLRLTEAVKGRGLRLERLGLLAPPWVVDDHVVVATEQGLAAYRFPPSGCMSPVEPVAIAWASPPPARMAAGAMDLVVSASGEGLILKRRLDDGNWEQEPLVSPTHTVQLRGLADRHHRVRLVLAAPDGRWSNELVHEFGEGEGGPREVALPAEPVAEPPRDATAKQAVPAPSPHVPVPRAQREEDRYWEHFPALPGQADPISAVGIDVGNGIWILVGSMCWHWDRAGGGWVKLEAPDGHSWEGIFGGGKHGLYITCRRGGDSIWKIHRLEAGASYPVTEVRNLSDTSRSPGFHLTRDGRILSWSPSQLRVYAEGSWQEWEVKVGPRPAVVEHGDLTSVFAGPVLCTLDPKGLATRVPVDPSVAEDPARWALLGDDRLLLLTRSRDYGIRGFRLSDGSVVDTSAINRLVGRAEKPQHLVSLPDGSVLLLVYAPVENCQRVYRIRPDGSTEEEVAARGLPLAGSMDVFFSPMPWTEPGGRVWFPSESAGVSYLENGQFRQFDYRTDGSPFRAEAFALDPDGVFYVAGDRRLHVYNQGTSVTGASRPASYSVASLGEEIWHVKMPEKAYLRGAQRLGASAAAGWVLDKEALKLLVLDLAKGKVGAALPLKSQAERSLRAGLGRTPGEVALCSPVGLAFMEAATGKTLATPPRSDEDHDALPPLPLPGERLLWLGKGSRWLVCRTHTGELVWRFPATGDTGEALQPSLIPGGHLIVQGSKWQGKAGSLYALDLDTGKRLWQVPARNDGVSLVPIDDGSRILTVRRTDQQANTDFWLACWAVDSGRKLWESCRPNTSLYHAPVYDPASRRVCAYFDDGVVVCLDARNGKPRWKRQLPQWPLTHQSGRWNPPFNDCLQRIPGAVMATDRTGDVTVLSIYTGEVLARYGVGIDDLSEGKRTGRRLPVTAPWLVGEQLIVCNAFAIRALPFPLVPLQKAAEATRPEGEEVADEQVEEPPVAPDERVEQTTGAEEGKPAVDDQAVAALVAQLGAAAFADREAAKQALLKLGKAVIPYLQTVRDSPDPEVRQQVRDILKLLE